ncbi:MAG: CAP domain-containing protein, partial [Pirellulales bacterium]
EYGHTDNGQRPSQRASVKGYDYCIVAENIAYAFSSQGYLAEPLAERFVSGWQQSPEHRRNMLDPDVVETGVAVAQRKETGVYFAVQMFGRPKSQRVEFQIVNRAGQEITYEVGQRSFDLPPRVTMTHGRCRPVDVTFHWPAQDEPATTTRKATSGNALVVERGDDGGFQVKQQAMDK